MQMENPLTNINVHPKLYGEVCTRDDAAHPVEGSVFNPRLVGTLIEFHKKTTPLVLTKLCERMGTGLRRNLPKNKIGG